jgi:hypothetical protein
VWSASTRFITARGDADVEADAGDVARRHRAGHHVVGARRALGERHPVAAAGADVGAGQIDQGHRALLADVLEVVAVEAHRHLAAVAGHHPQVADIEAQVVDLDARLPVRPEAGEDVAAADRRTAVDRLELHGDRLARGRAAAAATAACGARHDGSQRQHTHRV